MKGLKLGALASFLLAILSMMVVAFCYYYIQKSVITMGVMVTGVIISCYQASKCLKTIKKSN